MTLSWNIKCRHFPSHLPSLSAATEDVLLQTRTWNLTLNADKQIFMYRCQCVQFWGTSAIKMFRKFVRFRLCDLTWLPNRPTSEHLIGLFTESAGINRSWAGKAKRNAFVDVFSADICVLLTSASLCTQISWKHSRISIQPFLFFPRLTKNTKTLIAGKFNAAFLAFFCSFPKRHTSSQLNLI